MKTRILFPILALLIAFSGCKAKKTDHTLNTVPQESGFLFKQVTSDDQQIIGPMVNHKKGNIQWSTGSMFDISSDGNYLVYVASTAPNQLEGDVHIRSTKGGLSSIQRTFGISATSPVFSPDGNSISFSSTFLGQEDANICLIKTYEGIAIQHLTEGQAGIAKAPVFSSDGNRIFYSRGIPSTTYVKKKAHTIWRYSIWSMDKYTAVTTQYVYGSSPEYVSNDQLLFTKLNTTTNQGEIWLLDLKSGMETLILRDNERGFSTPKISPDGKRILCVGASRGDKPSDSNLDIYMINLNGTGFTQLTFHPATDASPCWSADGKSVFFLSKRNNIDDKYNIWSFDL